MRFLSKWKITPGLVPVYKDFHTDFHETIDCDLANIILQAEYGPACIP